MTDRLYLQHSTEEQTNARQLHALDVRDREPRRECSLVSHDLTGRRGESDRLGVGRMTNGG